MKSHFTPSKVLFLVAFVFLSHGIIRAQMTNLLWAQSFGNMGNESPVTLAIDGQGNVYMAGWMNDTLPLLFASDTVTNTLTNSFFLAKLDPSGNVLWAKNVGSGYGDNSPSGIAVDTYGNLYMVGSFESDTLYLPDDTLYNTAGIVDTQNNYGNTFIMKFDTSGNLKWAKNFGGRYTENGANAVTIDPVSNFYVTGSFGGDSLSLGAVTVYWAEGNSEFLGGAYVAKFDSSGNTLWANSVDVDLSSSIAYSPTGNLLITGYTYNDTLFAGSKISLNPLGRQQLYVVNYDTSGNVVWAQFMGGDSSAGTGLSLAADAQGNIYMTGDFIEKDITFGNTTFINDSINNGGDVFLVKMDRNANVLWARHAGGTLLDEGIGIAIDAESNAYIGGIFQSSTFTFEGTSDTFFRGNASGYVIFVAKYDSSGNLQWANSAQGNEDQTFSGIVTDGMGNAYIDGNFPGYIGFDSLLGNSQQFDTLILYNASNSGLNGNIFIAKFGPYLASGIKQIQPGQVMIYPNPSAGMVNISGLPVHSTIRLFDLTGRDVLDAETTSEPATVDLSAYPPGLYMLYTPYGSLKVMKME